MKRMNSQKGTKMSEQETQAIKDIDLIERQHKANMLCDIFLSLRATQDEGLVGDEELMDRAEQILNDIETRV